jgi:Tfp pilus assembly protein FimT
MHPFAQRGERGVTAIEIVFGVSIAALVLIFSVHSILQFVNAGRVAGEKAKAIYLAEEGLELVRFVRDESWNTISGLSANTTYYLWATGSAVGVTTTPQVTDGYTRSFRISNVYRNSSDDIVASTTGGASADTDSKYVALTVTWGAPTSTVSFTSILTNINP